MPIRIAYGAALVMAVESLIMSNLWALGLGLVIAGVGIWLETNNAD